MTAHTASHKSARTPAVLRSPIAWIDEPLAGDFLVQLDAWMHATDDALDAFDTGPMLAALARCRERVADALTAEADGDRRAQLRQLYDGLEAASRVVDCKIVG